MTMDIATVIDGALELSVVGSFSRVGYGVRRRVFGWDDPMDASGDGAMHGRTVLITGPTSGLGRAATDAIAAMGARIVLVGRSEQRLAAVRRDLAARHGEDRSTTVVADMGDLASVRAAVDTVLATESRLDAVIDNAGAIFPERGDSPDGMERTFALMTVGPFALIAGLRPLLERTGHARVVCVTSGGQYTQRLPLDDLAYREGTYNGPKAYARAKRAQVSLVREWARRLPRESFAINAMHPGWADTPGVAASLPGFYRLMGPILRTPAEGVDTAVWLATSPDAAGLSGGLFLDRRPRPFDRAPMTRLSAAERRRLWDLVVGLARIPDPAPEVGYASSPWARV